MNTTIKPAVSFRRTLFAVGLVTACGGEKIVEVVLDPAAIVLGVTDASFSVMEGEADPSPILVTVANGGEVQLGGLTASIQYGVGHSPDWLTASLDASTAPATLRLAPLTVQLFPGAYEATVSILAAGVANSPQDVAVSLTVMPGPEPARIELDGIRVEFETMEGGSDPSAQSVRVSNAGELPLVGLEVEVRYGLNEPTDWLSVSIDSVDAPTDLHFEASTSGIVAGSYGATVAIQSDAASNSPEYVFVDLVITANDPLIALSPEFIRFVATEGLDDPASRTFRVDNGGLGSLDDLSVVIDYPAGSQTGWLTASLSGTVAPAIGTVSATTGSLPEGTHLASVVVASPQARNGADTIDVEFLVRPPGPVIALSPQFLSFNAVLNGPAPAPQTVEVTNAQVGMLTDLLLFEIPRGGNGTWLSASLDRTTAPATVTVTVSTAGLPIDTYRGDVEVSSPVAQNVNGHESIGVTLIIAEGLPDLTIEGEVTTTQTIEAGTTLDLSPAIERNVGAVWSPSHFFGYYLSTDTTITPDDILIDSHSVSGLDPGEMRARPATQKLIPVSTPPGEYFVGFLVDDGEVITEEDESNNFVSAPITITPALTRYTLTIVDEPGAGGWIDTPPEVVFVDGETITLTAMPYQGFLFGGWGGDASGTDNPLDLVMDSDKTVSADFVVGTPFLGGSTLILGVSLSWNYTWPCVPGPSGCVTSVDDRFEIQESLTQDAADFQTIFTSDTGRVTSGQLRLDRPAGIHYYRLRAVGSDWASPYTDIVEVDVRPAPLSPM